MAVRAGPLLRRNHLEEMVSVMVEDVPTRFQVLIKRLEFILRKHDNFEDLRVNTITKAKIDKTVYGAKGNSRFGPVPGKRH